MSLRNAIFTMLALCMFGIAMMPPSMADSEYEQVYSGWIDNGKTVNAGGFYVKATISNGSTGANIEVKSPNLPSGEALATPGNSYYYYNVLRVYVAEIDPEGDRTLVDISRPVSATSGGIKVTCDAPGQKALGGDTVSFPIAIRNDEGGDRTYTLSASNGAGWPVSFRSGDMNLYQVYVPESQTKTVYLDVETSASSKVGEEKVTVNVNGNMLDLYVYITSVNQTADFSPKVSSKISSIGDKIYYEFRLKNLQSKENIYRLSVTGLQDNWYYRFKEQATSVEELAEIVVPAGSEKSLVLEIVPPYSVSPGDYNFTATAVSPEGLSIDRGLSLRLKSGVDMSVTSSRLAYEAKPGESFDIDVYVTNYGQGAALTNVYPDIDAPDGWIVSSSPEIVNSIKAGETHKFTVNVQPPGNIVASDYEVDITMKSDQAEAEKSYRITIKTESYIPYIGGTVIVLVALGLFMVYRKYGRR